MQLYVPELQLIYVPILKNASRVLSKALQERWGSVMTVGRHVPGERVVMWRSPKERIESTYRFMRDQGASIPDFAKWVEEVCQEGLRDPHLAPQLTFCDNPQRIFYWDFQGFSRVFKLRAHKIEHENESGTWPTEWDEKAKAAFKAAYKHDIRIWGNHAEAEMFGVVEDVIQAPETLPGETLDLWQSKIDEGNHGNR